MILPDTTVLVTEGGLHGETRGDAVHLAEIYDPATNTIRPAAEATVSRLYHSIALLLPDGRVVTAGSNPDRGDDELRLELYHPPYLLRGPRPLLESAPTEWSYGTTVDVSTRAACGRRRPYATGRARPGGWQTRTTRPSRTSARSRGSSQAPSHVHDQ